MDDHPLRWTTTECDHKEVPAPRHNLSPEMDQRLTLYAGRSWNSHEAVFAIQQLSRLTPVYATELAQIFGRSGLGDARRAWGVVADLCAAITGLPRSMATLIELGFEAATDVGHLVDPKGWRALVDNVVLRRLDLRPARLGNVDVLLRQAVNHDSVAKPLLGSLRDDMRALDLVALSSGAERRVATFGDLVRNLADEPHEFPWWEGRPMFLDEQRGLLEYITCHAYAETVADHLVDEQLGVYLLSAAGVLKRSDVTGRLVLDHRHVPHRLLARPAEVVAHQAGNAVIDALSVLDEGTDVFDRLFVAEVAVMAELDIDIAPAFTATRALATDKGLRAFTDIVVDITDRPAKLTNVQSFLYDFPELRED